MMVAGQFDSAHASNNLIIHQNPFIMEAVLTKESKKQLAKIEAEKNQKPVKEITFSIEWKKSRTWGFNPHLTADVIFRDGTRERSPLFKCSGCGYDKESTVVAQAFNMYLKYKLYQDNDGLKNPPYGLTLRGESKYYDGGVGISCYYRIAEAIKGNFANVAHGNTFDVYKYVDSE